MTAIEMELCPVERVLEMEIADAGTAVIYTAGDGIAISGGQISVNETIARIADLPDVSSKADAVDLAAHIDNMGCHVTTEEKERWNTGGFSGDYNDLKNRPEIPEMGEIQAYIDQQLGVIENGAY
jgi:hypothetical protein